MPSTNSSLGKMRKKKRGKKRCGGTYCEQDIRSSSWATYYFRHGAEGWVLASRHLHLHLHLAVSAALSCLVVSLFGNGDFLFVCLFISSPEAWFRKKGRREGGRKVDIGVQNTCIGGCAVQLL